MSDSENKDSIQNKTVLKLVEQQDKSEKYVKIYERQPGEPEKQWQAFRIYRDMGEARTLAAVAKNIEKLPEMLYRWSKQWHWQDRALAWDRAIDARRRKSTLIEVEQMRDRQWAALAAAYEVLGLELEKIKRVSADTTEPPLLKLRELPSWIESIFKNERLLYGQPSSITELKSDDKDSETEKAAKRALLGDREALAMIDTLLAKMKKIS